MKWTAAGGSAKGAGASLVAALLGSAAFAHLLLSP